LTKTIYTFDTIAGLSTDFLRLVSGTKLSLNSRSDNHADDFGNTQQINSILTK